MNMLLVEMEKRGWQLASIWLDLDDQHKPFVRFVRRDLDLIPPLWKNHIVFETARSGEWSIGSSLTIVCPAGRPFGQDVFVALSVNESELEELLEEQESKKKQEESEQSQVPSDEKPLSSFQREKLNKKLAEANIREDLKNRIRQQAIWLGGGFPRF